MPITPKECYFYNPIKQLFCIIVPSAKTPYRSQANLYGNENCLECTSPLTLLERESLKLFRRTMKRITIQGDFLFYLFWPGKPYCGFFQDYPLLVYDSGVSSQLIYKK